MNTNSPVAEFSRHRIAARGIAVALICALVGGCTTSRLASFKAGEPVSLAVNDSVTDLAVWNHHAGDDAKTGAKVGAGTGTVVAGALFGMLSGPLAPVMVPIGMLGGALGGALYGGAGGALVGANRGLPADKIEQLTLRLQRYTASHKLAEEFQSCVTAAVGNRWSLTQDAQAMRVQIQLRQMGVGLAPDDRLALRAAALVTVRYPSDRGRMGDVKWFHYQGPPSDFSMWVDGGNGHVEASVNTALQNVAAQIVADLSHE